MENAMFEKSPIIQMVGGWILDFKNPLKEHHDANARLIDSAVDMSTEAKLAAHKKNNYQYYAEVAGMYAATAFVVFGLPKLAPVCRYAMKQAIYFLSR